MSELIVLPEKATSLQVFSTEKGLDPFLKAVRDEIDSFVPDVSTQKGRKDIASLAYKIAQSKTALDKMGKELVDEYKEIPKKIDAERKRMRDLLDDWKDEARKPLTDWEAEQARIEAEEKAKKEAEALALQVEADHEIALLLNEKFDRDKEEKARQAEAARIEHEKKIAEAAAEKAKKEAEEKARIDREKIERQIAEAKLAQERAEREKLEAEQRAKLEAERAEIDKQRALQRAEDEKRKAIEAERQRQQEEADRIAREEAARAADVENRRSIHQAVIADILNAVNVGDEAAKNIVRAIVAGRIRHLQINY